MYHAADHTMSNVMSNLGLWEEEMSRLNKARLDKSIGDQEWTAMKTRAGRGDTPFLQALNDAVTRHP